MGFKNRAQSQPSELVLLRRDLGAIMRRFPSGRPAAAQICPPPPPIRQMIELNIPGKGLIQLEHLVCDVNGTLALDGQLIEGVAKRLIELQDRMTVHMVTADTHGRQVRIDQQLGLQAHKISPGGEVEAKAEYIRALGPDRVVALGQGANDAHMLREAILGICVLSPEGTALEALSAADLAAPDILAALDLLNNPLRLVATLRR